MIDLIEIMTGKDFGSPSPALAWVPMIEAAFPGIPYVVIPWKQPFATTCQRYKAGMRVVKVMHSFALFSGVLDCEEAVQDMTSPEDLLFHLLSADGVRWAAGQDPDLILDPNDDAFAQFCDTSPLLLPWNVLSCRCWHRSDFIGPKTATLANPGHIDFYDYPPTPGTNHNSLCAAIAPELIAAIRSIIQEAA